MTYKKKIKVLDSLFGEAKNLIEDPDAIALFRNDFTFYTKEVMQNDADEYLSEAEKIVFSPHLIQLETTNSINLKLGGFNTAKEEYCRLIEKMRVSIELNKESVLSVRPIDTIAITIKDLIISVVASILVGFLPSCVLEQPMVGLIITILLFAVIIWITYKRNLRRL